MKKIMFIMFALIILLGACTPFESAPAQPEHCPQGYAWVSNPDGAHDIEWLSHFGWVQSPIKIRPYGNTYEIYDWEADSKHVEFTITYEGNLRYPVFLNREDVTICR